MRVRKMATGVQVAVTVLASCANLFCQTNNCSPFSPRAAQLVDILNKAAERALPGSQPIPKVGQHPGQKEDLNCSQFFHQMMRELGTAGSAVNSEWTNPNATANDIADNISRSADWVRVDIGQVQDLANRGIVVVGAQHGANHGHVGTAFPIPSTVNPGNFPSNSQFKGVGPFVRDGNEHQYGSPDNPDTPTGLFPSSYGAVRANLAFDLHSTTWYEFKPSVPSWWQSMSESAEQWFANWFSSHDSCSDIVGTWTAKGTSLTITNTAGMLGGTITMQEVKCDNDTGGSCDESHPYPPETWPLTSVSFDGHTLSITFDYSHPGAMKGYEHRMVTVQGQLSGDNLKFANGVLTKVR